MSEPIPVRVTRYRCPHCARSASTKQRSRDHIRRCWHNPDARGCKTCQHYQPAEDDRCDAPYGCGGCGYAPEQCALGVSLDGRDACKQCGGQNFIFTGETHNVRFQKPGRVMAQCPECGGNGAPVKPGPIVHCVLWERAG